MDIKNEVLKLLIKKADYYSGEEISKELGVSRVTVNNAVNSLRKEGFAIHSCTNKGYLISEIPDIVNEGIIGGYAKVLGDIVCLEEVDSTNNHLKKMASSGAPSGSVVISETQTSGRGRLGKQFSSPKDVGVYLSYLYRPRNFEEVKGLTAKVALCVSQAIEKVCEVSPLIKWINDLVLNNKKICGILSEMSVEGESGKIEYVIVGVGINVNNEAFPLELCDIATSIKDVTGKRCFRPKLISSVIEELNALFTDLSIDRLIEYKKRCVTLNKEIKFTINGVERTGYAKDLDKDFGLIVDCEGESLTLTFGDVSVRGLYGYV